jgi:hypothetical protein
MRVCTCKHIAGQVSFSCTAGNNLSATCSACYTSFRLFARGATTGGAAGETGSADGVKPSLTNRVFMSCTALSVYLGGQPDVQVLRSGTAVW